MALPPSFARDGFVSPSKLRVRPRLMIGTDGRTNTGKTEFILSAPGPGIILCVDRGFDSMLDNPHPPATRRNDYAFKVIAAPQASQSDDPKFYFEHWKAFYTAYRAALNNADARTVAIDGDADSWELQRLAEHGRLTNIWPQTKYGDVYAARRVMISRAWDSGKIIIATNRVSDEYLIVRDAKGNPLLDKEGQPKKEKSGGITRKGFPDQDYLWQLQIRHLYAPRGFNTITKKPTPAQWGLRILKCKADTTHEGVELWGQDCNFQSLVQLIYPQVTLKEWGY